MIKTDFLRVRQDGTILVETYSTENFIIRQVETGAEYEKAIDIGTQINGQYYPMRYVYVETNIKIPEESERLDEQQ